MRDFAAARRPREKEGADAREDGRPAARLGIARAARSHADGGIKVNLALFARGVGCRARDRDRKRPGGRGKNGGPAAAEYGCPVAAEDGSRRGSHAADRCGRFTVENGGECTRPAAGRIGDRTCQRPRQGSHVAGRGGKWTAVRDGDRRPKRNVIS